MKRYKIVFLLIASIAIFSSCNKDFLERYPLDRISEAEFFKTPVDLETYMNRFYCLNSFPNQWTAVTWPSTDDVPERLRNYPGGNDDFNSDLQLLGDNVHSILNGDKTINSSSWNWGLIREINYFFDQYRRCPVPENLTDLAQYRQTVGEAHFFRALYYFRLLKSNGDVPWYSTVLGTNSPELYAPRTPRHVVADSIIADLDKSAEFLQVAKTNGNNRINKWVALLYQSRIALYEGCWQKYHADTDFAASVSNPQKYFNKAVEAAQAVMNSELYSIYSTGNPENDYYALFSTIRDYSGNSEVLFWTQFNVSDGFSNNKNFQMRFPRQRCITRRLADAYLCTDGDPISVSSLFQGYDDLTKESTDRDPRFKQTIFTPDAPWQTDASNNVTNWQNCYVVINTGGSDDRSPTGYHQRKRYDTRDEFLNSNFENSPMIQFRYAEALLNYAEAKAELGTLTQADVNISINLLRDRVGMPNLTIANITTDSNWSFPSLSPVINEIRRERLVELACEGYRWDDIMRWAAAGELIVGKRPLGTKSAQYGNRIFPDTDGFYDPLKNALPDGYGFKLNRDYLDPIPPTEIVRNPNLTQNPGWTM